MSIDLKQQQKQRGPCPTLVTFGKFKIRMLFSLRAI